MAATVRSGTPEARWILLATVLGSGMAALDATVVNIALPAIGEDLGAQLSGLQWILTGYLITLSALILLGGSLGDLFGRKRIFTIGVIWFTAASVLCSLAPTVTVLVAARVLQGVGGALLTPGSLAIIEASFAKQDRGHAIGMWSGLGGVATAIGPLLGGLLVTSASWRFIFWLNLPLAAAVLIASKHVPETSDPLADRHVDVVGAALAVLGLAATTFALIQGSASIAPWVIALAGVIGVSALIGFVVVERRSTHPMLPLSIFSSRQFTAANLVTLAVYAALGGVLFLLALQLQQVLGYSAVEAGASLLPVTLIMLAFSARAGALAQRIGPRIPMTLGPTIVACGLLLMRRIDAGGHFVTDVLPAIIVFGSGLALTVAPLTATVLGAVDDRHAGVASAVNNAVARVAGLLAVAVLPQLSGLRGAGALTPSEFSSGFDTAVTIGAGLCLVGALVAFVGIAGPAPSEAPAHIARANSCAVDAPPLRRS
jgi:EmrB/QacA subfamily drug resistance transporter